MANYSAIKITNNQTIAVATKSPTSGTTEVTQMASTNHDFISVSIDDTTDTITGITSSGTTIIYQSHAENSGNNQLTIAFVA